ncbi:MAG: ATP-binding protein [Deltaproteobacteria bacterium]
MPWGFYGRTDELHRLQDILGRNRWFFVKITGRRRIGKTTLIQQALQGGQRVFYVQIPDSGPVGVLSAVADAMDTFEIPAAAFPRPATLADLAKLVGNLARAGYAVALDEFQYFNRERLRDFCSLLQAEVDVLSAQASRVPGGLLVLGSVHTEMAAVLQDAHAPLYNRTTDELELGHLDVESVLEILAQHATVEPSRLLFLWTLFEGVPKFYRDCFEQGVLDAPRRELLERAFFASSSPLRTEADNWFLKELHGRYDVILKYVARHPGCSSGELVEHVRQVSPETNEQVGGYLKVLIEKYRIIEKRLPIFAKKKEKKGRYYLTDNFLRAWLAALASPVSAMAFRPLDVVVRQADERLADVEGPSLEKLVATLYEERSRKGIGDFGLTERVQGYWDRADTEIDLVAVAGEDDILRVVTCKRSPEKLVNDLPTFDGHVARFVAASPRFGGWTVEKVAVSPMLDPSARKLIETCGYIAQDLADLTAGLRGRGRGPA